MPNPSQNYYISIPFSGQIEHSIGEQILPIPNFFVLKNIVFETSGTMRSRYDDSLVTIFNPGNMDNPIQLITYKNQLLTLGEEGIYLYDETDRRFNQAFDKENLRIGLELISQKEVDILYPSIILINDIAFLFYFADNQILLKKYDLAENRISSPEAVLESNVEVTGISSYRSSNNRIYYAYSIGKQIIIKEIERISDPTDPLLERRITAGDSGVPGSGGEIVNMNLVGDFVYYTDKDPNVETDNDKVVYSYNYIDPSSEVEAPRYSFRDNFRAIFSRISDDGSPSVGANTLYDFRLWSNFSLNNNNYQVIWTPEIGTFVMNNNGVVLAKFNSNFVPLVQDEKMKFIGETITYNNTVYLPLLQSGQDEFENRVIKRPLNLALLSISISNDFVNIGFANDQMIIGGEILSYYDGESIVEQGFFERPRVMVISNPNPFERTRIDIPITTDQENVVERKIRFTQTKNEDFLISGEFTITAEPSIQRAVFRQVAGVVTTPTATSYDLDNNSFTGLTSGWTQAFPAEDADPMTSIYKSFVIIKNDGSDLVFSTPFVVTDNDDTNDDSIANQTGWRQDNATSDKFGSVDGNRSLLNRDDTDSDVDIYGVYFNSNEGQLVVEVNGSIADKEIGFFSIEGFIEGENRKNYIYPHERIGNNYYYYTNVNPFINNQDYKIQVHTTISYESITPSPLSEFDENININKIQYIEAVEPNEVVEVRTDNEFTLEMDFAEIRGNFRRYAVGTVDVSDTRVTTNELFQANTIRDTDTVNVLSSEYNSATRTGSVIREIPESNFVENINRVYLKYERISIDNEGESMEIPAQSDLEVRTGSISTNNNLKQVIFSNGIGIDQGSVVNAIPNNTLFNSLSFFSSWYRTRSTTTTSGGEGGSATRNVRKLHFTLNVSGTINPSRSSSWDEDDLNFRLTSSGSSGSSYAEELLDFTLERGGDNWDELWIEIEGENALETDEVKDLLDELYFPINLRIQKPGETADNILVVRTLREEENRRGRFDNLISELSEGSNPNYVRSQLRIDEDRLRIRMIASNDSSSRANSSSSFSSILKKHIGNPSSSSGSQRVNFNLIFEPTSEAPSPIRTSTNVVRDTSSRGGGLVSLFYKTKSSYTDANDFRRVFGNSASVKINDSSRITLPTVNYATNSFFTGPDPTATFSRSFSGSNFPSLLENMIDSSPTNVKIEFFNSSGEVHPSQSATTKTPVITRVDNNNPDNLDIILWVTLSRSYRRLSEFTSGSVINVFLNDISLVSLNNYSNHKLGFFSGGRFREATAVNGNVLQLQWTVRGEVIANNRGIRNLIEDLFTLSNNYTVDVRLGTSSLFTTSSSNTRQVSRNFGSNLSNRKVAVNYGTRESRIVKNFDIDNIVVDTFQISENNIDKPEIIEFNLSSLLTNLNSGITIPAGTTLNQFTIDKIEESIQNINIIKLTRSINNQFSLNLDNATITTSRASNKLNVKLRWVSPNMNGTDSLSHTNFGITPNTTFQFQNNFTVGTEFERLVSLNQLTLEGDNISEGDVDSRILVERGVERHAILVNVFRATPTKAFLRRNITTSYPFVQNSDTELDFVYFAIETSEEATGEVMTVDNINERRAYIYSAVFKWVDGRGFEHRSTQALQKDVLTSQDISESNPIGLRLKCLNLTNKQGVKVELFRTAKNTTVLRKLIEFFNREDLLDLSFEDTIPDTQLGEVLLSDTFFPDGGNIIEVYQDRFFVSGFQNFKNEIQYSNPLNFGGSSAVKFEEANSILAEEEVIGLKKMDNRLIIFTTKQIYIWTLSAGIPQVIEGSSNISPINTRSIQSTPLGLVFQTDNSGYYMLDRGLNTLYIGLPVQHVDSSECVSSTINKSNQEILFFTRNHKTLVYNYVFKKWSEITAPGDLKSSILHKDEVFLLSGRKLKKIEPLEDISSNSDSETTTRRRRRRRKCKIMNIDTGWIQLDKIQNYQKIKSFIILGNFKSLVKLQVQVYYNFQNDITHPPLKAVPSNFDLPSPLPSPEAGDQAGRTNPRTSVYGGKTLTDVKQFRFMMTRQKCSAIKLRIEICAEDAELSAITFQLRVLGDVSRLPASQQFSSGSSGAGTGAGDTGSVS